MGVQDKLGDMKSSMLILSKIEFIISEYIQVMYCTRKWFTVGVNSR